MSFDALNHLYLIVFLLMLLFIGKNKKEYLHYFTPKMIEKIFIGIKKRKTKEIFLILSFIFLVVALARPIIENNPITIQQKNISFVVAFDISKSMLAKDVEPNRLLFAKKKFHYLLSKLKDEKVGLIGFSNRSYLISPITNDHSSLQYLVDNLNTDLVSTKGSNLLEALQGVQKLLGNEEKKAVIFFTDGTDKKDFKEEIEFAKINNIKVFIYAIGTKKGSSIEDKTGVVLDKNGNIVITKLGDKSADLALLSDGAYLEYSTNMGDIDRFLEAITLKFEDKEQKELKIENNFELFQIPLFLAIIFLFLGYFGTYGFGGKK